MKKVYIIISLILVIISFVAVPIYSQISRQEFNEAIKDLRIERASLISDVKKEIEQVQSDMKDFNEMNSKIAAQSVKIDDLNKSVTRIEGIFDKIFFIMLTSVISVLLGGGGIGYAIGKGKCNRKP